MRIHFYRNTSSVRRRVAKLPIRQTLIWFGPVFIRVQR